jgi:hypothetical protein
MFDSDLTEEEMKIIQQRVDLQRRKVSSAYNFAPKKLTIL